MPDDRHIGSRLGKAGRASCSGNRCGGCFAFRAYDPCHGCATHALPGQMPLVVRLYDPRHELIREIRQDGWTAEGPVS